MRLTAERYAELLALPLEQRPTIHEVGMDAIREMVTAPAPQERAA